MKVCSPAGGWIGGLVCGLLRSGTGNTMKFKNWILSRESGKGECLMNQNIKNAVPVLLAVLVLLVTEIINWMGIVPPVQNTNFETMCNFLLLAVAVGSFFLQGLPSAKNGQYDLTIILSNITVSAIAFPINIDVFKHSIRSERFWGDIWGWHAGWLLVIFVQILALSGWGSKLSGQIRSLLRGVSSASTKMGKGLLLVSGKLGDFFSVVSKTAGNINKRIFLIIFIGVIIWGLYLKALYNEEGVGSIFLQMEFWRNSFFLWMYYLVIILVVHVIIAVFQKVKNAISKKVENTIYHEVFIDATTKEQDIVIQETEDAVTLEEQADVSQEAKDTAETTKQDTISQKSGNNTFQKEENAFSQTGGSKLTLLWLFIKKICSITNLKYVFILIVSFVVVPLTILFLLTFFWSDGDNINLLNSSDPVFRMEVFNAIARTADELLKQFM